MSFTLTSVKLFSSLKWRNEVTMFVWKSFHFKKNCWSDDIIQSLSCRRSLVFKLQIARCFAALLFLSFSFHLYVRYLIKDRICRMLDECRWQRFKDPTSRNLSELFDPIIILLVAWYCLLFVVLVVVYCWLLFLFLVCLFVCQYPSPLSNIVAFSFKFVRNQHSSSSQSINQSGSRFAKIPFPERSSLLWINLWLHFGEIYWNSIESMEGSFTNLQQISTYI